MNMNESLFGFRNPTENTLKRFQVLHDTLAKENVRLELEICTLQNEPIEYHRSLDVIEAKVFLQKTLASIGVIK